MLKYIYECINSIILQNLKDIEIIIVNDGSKDNTLKILQSFKDERIIIINKINEGLTKARNDALKVARGKYIVFVDGDDFIKGDFIKFYEYLEKYNCDILIFDYYKKTTKDEILVKQNLPLGLVNKNDGFNKLIKEKLSHNIWGKIYKKELFRDIKFPNGIFLGEDFDVYVKLFYLTKNI